MRLLPNLTVIALLLTVLPALAGPPTSAVLETKVTGFSKDRGMVAVSAGSKEGVEVGDRFWVFREGGIEAAGEIQVVTAEGSAGVAERSADIAPGRPVTILRSAALIGCRDELPPEVTIRGRISRVAPGRRNAWLDIGEHSGLKTGDTLLVRRLTGENVEIPVARGRVEIVRDDTALVVLEPLVSNSLPQPGDVAELWPSPADRRLGRLESMVLKTRPAKEPEGDLSLTIVGGIREGLESGRLVDLFHGRQYIGYAAVTEVGEPNSSALMFTAVCKQRAQEGDRAWVRSPAGPPVNPLTAAIFQIVTTPEGVFAQIAAGETDGVTIGERFIVRHYDPADETIRRDIAELIVQSVHVDHATAAIRLINPQGEAVRLWDFAERRKPMSADWRPIGIIRGPVQSRTAVADLGPRSPATVGRIVRCMPGDSTDPKAPPQWPGAAIVINHTGEEAILYVPPGWGEVEELVNAGVELAEPSTTTAPAASR